MAAGVPQDTGRQLGGKSKLYKELERALRQVQKPGRYTGGEPGSVHKDKSAVSVRFAVCFPDIYEVGMSHLGMKILYGLLNRMPGVWCERVFQPRVDFEEQMRARRIPLYGLESGDPIRDFDFLGFSLMYEMSYTGMLDMLDLAGVPLRAADRSEGDPIVICGGPCVCNPEPVAAFADLFCLGDGEETTCKVVELYTECRAGRQGREAFLRRAAAIPGIYVPSLYDVEYAADGTLAAVRPRVPSAPARIRKSVVTDLDAAYFPGNFVLPFINIVHDRAMIEAFRGCIRGCRFCQAGFTYRPIRERSHGVLSRQARALCDATGYDEVSVTSLSTSDYSQLGPLLDDMLAWTDGQRVGISLPSLRADNFSRQLMQKISSVRKSRLTVAAEAGTQRLRDVINKNIREEDILDTCRTAFSGGWTSVKLYFMLGLPTETTEDIEGIAALAQKVVDLYYHMPERPKGRSVHVSVSVSTFVPKPMTPFQWEPQDTIAEIDRKQRHLISCIGSRKIQLSYHEADRSFLEAALARGDRRLADVLEEAFRLGCRLDSWNETFSFEKWMQAFRNVGSDPAFYASRRRGEMEIFPWDHLDYGVSRGFLWRENQKARRGEVSPNCRQCCNGCGANRLEGGCPLCAR